MAGKQAGDGRLCFGLAMGRAGRNRTVCVPSNRARRPLLPGGRRSDRGGAPPCPRTGAQRQRNHPPQLFQVHRVFRIYCRFPPVRGQARSYTDRAASAIGTPIASSLSSSTRMRGGQPWSVNDDRPPLTAMGYRLCRHCGRVATHKRTGKGAWNRMVPGAFFLLSKNLIGLGRDSI